MQRPVIMVIIWRCFFCVSEGCGFSLDVEAIRPCLVGPRSREYLASQPGPQAPMTRRNFRLAIYDIQWSVPMFSHFGNDYVCCRLMQKRRNEACSGRPQQMEKDICWRLRILRQKASALPPHLVRNPDSLFAETEQWSWGAHVIGWTRLPFCWGLRLPGRNAEIRCTLKNDWMRYESWWAAPLRSFLATQLAVPT